MNHSRKELNDMAEERRKYVQRRTPKPKNLKGTIKRVMSYVLSFRLQIVLVVFLILLSVVASVASAYFLKPLINDYITPLIGVKDPDYSGLLGQIGLMAAIYIIGAFSSFIYSRIMVSISTGVLCKIRMDLFAHLQKLPIRYYDTNSHGDIMSRFTNDTDTLRQMMSMTLPQLIQGIASIIFTAVVMLSLNVELSLVVFGMMIISMIAIVLVSKRSQRYFKEVQQAMGDLNGYGEEMIEGQRVIKVFNREEIIKEGFSEINARQANAGFQSQAATTIMMPMMANLSYITYALCAVLGASMTINNRLDIGTIASFLEYSRTFTRPITQISNQFNYIMSALAGAERVFDLLDTPEEVDEGNVTLVNANIDEEGNITEASKRTGKWAWKIPNKDGSFEYRELKGDVRFEHVTFGYEEKKIVLNDISLYAEPGQKIAFVGSTGAGKTTITNLINRFYDVPDGKIRYDGININRIKKNDLRRSLGMVLQDTNLFTGTVMDNIRFGNLEATDEECIKAAKLANADSFIRKLPHGYDTMLEGNGSNLSQGQRQLLSIARAAVADPPVLILDEATSSIDTRTEHLIEQGMDGLMHGRTVFVIAHRLSTVRNSNAIMVLEHGVIIERGTHESLIEEHGKYYQLYTGALELE
ncbi:MAG: ABC transporter ATP-binding protein [Clostridia bacterium]|nr:ABC transporter ATP-binding protein [Clostridia bacterium]MBQ5957049.1 ABC transporter ATP-binding protein [Clostridia bacterium]